MARYITPVSKNKNPRESASLRPSVDLPEAAGPSRAIIEGGVFFVIRIFYLFEIQIMD
jgi:hypothetical protein